MKTRLFTAGVLMRRGRLLVMKRSQTDDTYPGLWDCVGGHFELGESAEECMARETLEETGLKAKIVRPGRLIEYRDSYGRSIAVPFLLESRSGEPKLSEHLEYGWARPDEARRLRAVPTLRLALDAFDL